MNILQIDGGGIKGIIPAMVLEHLENRCRQPLYDVFDLVIGTSTGAIIGGALAAGVPAREIAQFYLTEGKELFKNKNGLGLGLVTKVFSRDKFAHVIGGVKLQNPPRYLNELHLRDLKINYIATTFNICSQRTHFIKSFQKSHRDIKLLDAISWSALSAAHFFGSISVDDYVWHEFDAVVNRGRLRKGAVFQDGGQGMYNNTISHVLTEILAHYKRYPDNYILSLGTGTVPQYEEYEKWRGKSNSNRERRNFSNLFTNQAWRESTPSQLIAGRYVDLKNSGITFTRIDRYIKKEEDKPFDIKYIDLYEEIGNTLCDLVTDELLDELRKHKSIHLDDVA